MRDRVNLFKTESLEPGLPERKLASCSARHSAPTKTSLSPAHRATSLIEGGGGCIIWWG